MKNLVSSPRTAISTFNFLTGSPFYCAGNTKKFLFGEKSHDTSKEYISQILEALISRTGNNVVVGHDTIIGILNVQKIAAETIPHNSCTT